MIALSLITLLLFPPRLFAPHSVASNLATTVQQTTELPAELPLLHFLAELGKAHQCYFTLEEAWQDNEPMNQVEVVWMSKTLLENKLQDALEMVHQKSPNLAYAVNKRNPRIVHLIDTRLARQRGYALENVIGGINFQGTSRDLLDAINSHGMKIQSPSLLDLHEARRLKSDYPMRIIGGPFNVREILCGFADLENHGRILWIARTKLGDNEITNLYLYR